jgi:hypothetical protein
MHFFFGVAKQICAGRFQTKHPLLFMELRARQLFYQSLPMHTGNKQAIGAKTKQTEQ